VPELPLTHQLISASAGSGKTFTLVTRLIRLLASGVAPERILALTFSRAAAGEIFDALVKRLAEAALTAGAAAREAALAPPLPGYEPQQFCALLRALLRQMHRSAIGTLDSFFIRIIGAFPYEFGLSGELTILENHDLRREKELLLREILHRNIGGSAGDAEATALFLEAFKQATFGSEVKNVRDQLEQFTTMAHSLLLEAPAAQLWGDPAQIWPDGCAWLQIHDIDPALELTELRQSLSRLDLELAQQQVWDELIVLIQSFHRDSVPVLPKHKSHLFWKLLEAHAQLVAGDATVVVARRKQPLAPELCRNCERLVRYLVGTVLHSKLQTTRGLYEIVRRYEQAYARRLRRHGKLTFADVTLLLANGSGLSGDCEAGPDRLYIDYRLDSSYDHWALDEFQDTSRNQWLVIANLVDEIVQDDSRRRSLFVVGDVKQAIHGWRGGDPALMTELQQRYNTGSTARLAKAELYQSWRSSRHVLGAVNQVFANLGRVSRLPPAVRQRWLDPPAPLWVEHEAARPDLDGYATLLQLPYNAGTAEAAAQRYAVAAAILLELQPWTRDLSTAVLVRNNRTGVAVAEALRAAGVPAAWDGDLAIADNPLCAALLALLSFAEHPGDSFAWNHLLMTPLAPLLVRGRRRVDKGELADELLDSLYRDGFKQTLELWAQRLQTHFQLDAFSRRRLVQLLGAAQNFDAGGNRNCLDFVDFVQSYTVRDLPGEAMVRVMSMHRSKGLGFDLVLLPDLQSGSITSIGQLNVAAERQLSPQHGIRWILELPCKDIVRADPVLIQHLERRELDSCFEELCLLYVAMTRAKQGLYMISTAPGPGSQSLHMSSLLVSGLGDACPPSRAAAAAGSYQNSEIVYAAGNRRWYEVSGAAAPTPSQPTLLLPPLPPSSRTAAPPLVRHLPQPPLLPTADAAALFYAATGTAMQAVSAATEFVRNLQWLPPTAATDLPAMLKQLLPAERHADCLAMIVQLLQDADIREHFYVSSSSVAPQLWRQRAFEVVIDQQWISGTLHRVVIEAAPTAQVHGARYLHIVANPGGSAGLPAARQHWQPELQLYRRIVAMLLELPESKVTATLAIISADS